MRKTILLRGALAVVGSWCLTLVLSAETLRLATYNVENYNLADRVVDGVWREKYPKPEEQKAALRTVIKALDADVLALQEIGGAQFLQELRRDLEREGCAYPHAEVLAALDAERCVAVLSRRKFTHVRGHMDLVHDYLGEKTGVLRGMLEVRLTFDGEEVAICVLHLKSRRTDRKDDPESLMRRSGEAVAVRERLLELFPEPAKSPFFVLGDFNDTTQSRPLRAFYQRGKLTLTEPLRAADGNGETWTHRYLREDIYSRVDYVLASPAARKWVRTTDAKIFDHPETKKASDHRPVLVVLSAAGQ